jgi:putative tricarboxylic transport membrane protein
MAIDRISGIVLLILAVFVAVETRVLPLGDHSNPGPGYLPLLLASILAVLSVVLIIRTKGSPLWKSVKWDEKFHAGAIIACCFLATFLIEPLGYRITLILILGFLFGVLERMKIWWALILALALSWGTFCVFDRMLMVPLPRGGLGI